jgi:hypothetical protein
MIYEKIIDFNYEVSCHTVNFLLINKKEEVIPQIQNTIKKLSGLLVDLKKIR